MDFTKYDRLLKAFNVLESDWSAEVTRSKDRRDKRKLDAPLENWRSTGRIAQDEAYIAERVIHINISRALPAYIRFLRPQDRIVSMSVQGDTTINCSLVEDYFTQGVMYPQWLRPFKKMIDGALLHGWDAMELEFDISKPLDLGFNHIGHDRLMFNKDAEDIQSCDLVSILYSFSTEELLGMKDFDPEAVKKIVDKDKDKENKFYDVYKVFFRVNGIVNFAWITKDAESWLKPPAKLFLGRKAQITEEIPVPSLEISIPSEPTDLYEEDYPIFVFVPYLTEEKKITSNFGRAFLDGPAQEALTAIMSATVTQQVRASNIYGSPKQAIGGTAGISDIELKPMKIYKTGIDFWSMPAPSATAITVFNALHTQNSADSNQVAWAVNNRKDTEKTATEVQASMSAQEVSNMEELSSFSTDFLAPLLNRMWTIVQNRWQAGLIQWNVPEQYKGYTYIVLPAGDIDIFKRQQKIQLLLQAMQLLAQTAAGPLIIKEYLTTAFPHDAAKFEKFFNDESQGKLVVSQLLQVLQGAMSPQEMQSLPPQQQQQLTQIIQSATQYVQG